MPKRKSGKKFKFPKISGKVAALAITGAVVVSAAAGIVYAKINDESAAFRVGGIRAGIWFDPNTGEPHVETGKFGCCLPMCSNSFELECQQLSEGIESATFDTRMCTHVEECQEGCCQIDCRVRSLPQKACEYMGGDWSETCQIGCCETEYSESEIPEKTCKCNSSATWYPGTCAKGWSVHLTGGEEGKLDFSDDWAGAAGKQLNAFLDMAGGNRDQSIDHEYYLYNCSETVYDTWYGTKKTTTYSGQDGETKTEEKETEITVPEEGIKTEWDIIADGMGTVSVDIHIDGNTFIIEEKAPFIGDITTTGTIMKGAEECKNRKSLDDF